MNIEGIRAQRDHFTEWHSKYLKIAAEKSAANDPEGAAIAQEMAADCLRRANVFTKQLQKLGCLN